MKNNEKKIKLLLLDVGGIILKVNWNASVKVLQQVDKNVRADILSVITNHGQYLDYECGKISTNDFLYSIQKLIGQKFSLAIIKEAWMNCLLEQMDNIENILDKIDIPIHALSNTNALHYEYFINLSPFQRFTKIHASHHIGIRKPDPQIYIHTISSIRMNPKNILFIDDLKENVMAARFCGLCSEQSLTSNDTTNILEKYFII